MMYDWFIPLFYHIFIQSKGWSVHKGQFVGCYNLNNKSNVTYQRQSLRITIQLPRSPPPQRPALTPTPSLPSTSTQTYSPSLASTSWPPSTPNLNLKQLAKILPIIQENIHSSPPPINIKKKTNRSVVKLAKTHKDPRSTPSLKTGSNEISRIKKEHNPWSNIRWK